MKVRSGYLLPWLVVVLPAATLIAVWYGLRWYLHGLTDVSFLLSLPFQVTAACVLAVSILLGLAVHSVVRRYREQIRVREQALREFNASMEERVLEELRKRRERDKALVQRSKMAAAEETVSTIAHHIEAALREAEASFVSAKYMVLSGDAEDAAGKIEAARKNLTDLADAFDRIRVLYRPDDIRTEVTLSDALAEVLLLLERDPAFAGIETQTRFDCAVTLPLYHNLFVQVLLSVLQNAKEALKSRGTAHPRIEVECYETGQFIVIRISDNAGGVEAEAEARIFEPFFSTKSGSKNAGIGLYLARNIVEGDFNGELTFDNLGEGVCFYIKLGKHQEGTDV